MLDVANMGKQTGRLRHRWGEPIRFPYKTERTCNRCHLCKVTRHEPGELPWLEFYRGMDKLKVDRTPVCEPVEVPFQ